MARTREFDPREALDAAMTLFWEQGFGDTSMEDIVESSGVSRYGLYGTFGNKRELYIAALKRYAQQMATENHAHLFSPDANRDDIEKFLRGVVDRADGPEGGRGCMVCNAAIEIAPTDSTVAHAVRDLYDQLGKAFANSISNGQAAGNVNPSLDPQATGQLLVGTMQGMVVLARAGTGKTRLNAYVDSAMSMLE
ncbi:MAG: TetR/AcrR family transcriptional regulator [Gammaproteobacteria bacterium]